MFEFRLKIGKLILLCAIATFTSCTTTQKLTRKEIKTLDEQIQESPIFSKIFTGFALYNPSTDSLLYQKDADKYYTPASNTKLFTLYTTLKVLGDSLPVLRYFETPNFTILQGTGNPMFMHPDFPVDSNLVFMMSRFPGIIYFSNDNYKDKRFGPGWSWGDYAYSYQTEKAAMPIYGNFLRVKKDSNALGFNVYPSAYQNSFYYNPVLDRFSYPVIQREETENKFAYNKAARTGQAYLYDRPIYDMNTRTLKLLGYLLEKDITLYNGVNFDSTRQAETVWRPLPDTLLRKFMQESDNSIGEQLLLACSAKLFDGELNSEKVIKYAKENLLNDLPDDPIWVDGSGLSRYNLFTPRTMIALLSKLYDEKSKEWLFDILPNGGKSGTIKNWYGGKGEPYVFAKTGTLSNKHCLSGYIKTKTGDILIFSFMNNNYVGSSSPVKKEMQRVLEWIWENY